MKIVNLLSDCCEIKNNYIITKCNIPKDFIIIIGYKYPITFLKNSIEVCFKNMNCKKNIKEELQSYDESIKIIKMENQNIIKDIDFIFPILYCIQISNYLFDNSDCNSYYFSFNNDYNMITYVVSTKEIQKGKQIKICRKNLSYMDKIIFNLPSRLLNIFEFSFEYLLKKYIIEYQRIINYEFTNFLPHLTQMIKIINSNKFENNNIYLKSKFLLIIIDSLFYLFVDKNFTIVNKKRLLFTKQNKEFIEKLIKYTTNIIDTNIELYNFDILKSIGLMDIYNKFNYASKMHKDWFNNHVIKKFPKIVFYCSLFIEGANSYECKSSYILEYPFLKCKKKKVEKVQQQEYFDVRTWNEDDLSDNQTEFFNEQIYLKEDQNIKEKKISPQEISELFPNILQISTRFSVAPTLKNILIPIIKKIWYHITIDEEELLYSYIHLFIIKKLENNQRVSKNIIINKIIELYNLLDKNNLRQNIELLLAKIKTQDAKFLKHRHGAQFNLREKRFFKDEKVQGDDTTQLSVQQPYFFPQQRFKLIIGSWNIRFDESEDTNIYFLRISSFIEKFISFFDILCLQEINYNLKEQISKIFIDKGFHIEYQEIIHDVLKKKRTITGIAFNIEKFNQLQSKTIQMISTKNQSEKVTLGITIPDTFQSGQKVRKMTDTIELIASGKHFQVTFLEYKYNKKILLIANCHALSAIDESHKIILINNYIQNLIDLRSNYNLNDIHYFLSPKPNICNQTIFIGDFNIQCNKLKLKHKWIKHCKTNTDIDYMIIPENDEIFVEDIIKFDDNFGSDHNPISYVLQI